MAQSGDKRKRDKNIGVWLTEGEVEELDRACAEIAAQVPGARVSRSAYVGELVRADLRRRAAAQ